MGDWITVQTVEDIEYLMREYGGFHDTCLMNANYVSGAYVDDSQGMYFGSPEQRELRIVFHSQWKKEPLELCFNGVRKYGIIGWQDHYDCCLFGCHLSLRRDLLPGRDDPLFVWSDNAYFSPKRGVEENILAEPMDSFVIAAGLKWHFLS